MLIGRLDAALLRSGQTEAAIKLLTDWTAQHPADMVAAEQLADIYIATRRYDDGGNQPATPAGQVSHTIRLR